MNLRLTCLAALLLAPALSAADIDLDASYMGKRAIVLSNGVLEVTVLEMGGPMPKIVLLDDAEKLNPMWDSFRADQLEGRPIRDNGGVGHFICVDGFGPVTKEEAAAGLSGHGEAADLPWSTAETSSQGGAARLVQTVHLPLHHEVFTRTIEMRDGENVVRVHGELNSLLAFDRPANWAEHATIGTPFLERGVTVVDMSSNRAMTRPREKGGRDRNHRLTSAEEFQWPMAPTRAGGKVDLRAAPVDDQGGTLDHTGHLMTPGGEYAWVTALHPKKRLLIGYLFKTSEYPWLQTWENYPAEGLMSRGLEFGTQAFDVPRRETVTENKIFGELLYRWLPAKSTISSTYLMFWTHTPEGMQGVDSVALSGGRLTLQDRRSGRQLVLPTAQTLD